MKNQPSDLQSILTSQALGPLNPRERQVVAHVRSCRTAVLGGMRWRCDHCEHHETHFHSCRDRHCPKCQREQSQTWRERQRADVLPVTYHHAVFTLPSALNGWVSLHPDVIYQALFSSVWKTLSAFGADPKRLNGQMGMSAVLHTWGEALTRHVHVHCLIPGGALQANGQWRAARSHYLFPVRALSRHFRGTMVGALRAAATAGQLTRVTRDGEIDALLDQLMQSEWVVFSKACPGRAEQVVDYLARYSHRIAISDERIVKADESHVSFRVKDYANRSTRRTLTLNTAEFIRRYLLHILPKGLMRVRHYGFLANRCRRQRLREIRTALEVGNTAAAKRVNDLTSDDNQQTKSTHRACPACLKGLLQARYRLEPRELMER